MASSDWRVVVGESEVLAYLNKEATEEDVSNLLLGPLKRALDGYGEISTTAREGFRDVVIDIGRRELPMDIRQALVICTQEFRDAMRSRPI